MNDPIATLRLQLQQLKALHDSGTLDDDAYAKARAPLERRLLDAVMAQPAASTTATAPAAAQASASAVAPAPRPSKNLVALLSVAVLATAVTGYLGFGSPGLPSAGPPGSRAEAAAPGGEGGAPHAMDEGQFAAAVEKLAERLKAEPDNAEGWSMLARSYARLGKHAEAVPAFAKAVALVGDDPRLLTDYADALAMQNGRVLEGEPMRLVERALKADPDNAKALALAGTAAFNRKDFPTAVRQWERLARVAPPDSPFLPQLQASIDEARSLGGMPKAPPVVPTAQPAPTAQGPLAAAPADASTPGGAPANPAAAAGAALTGTVRLSPALAKLAAPDDVVFIFARPADGGRMPLAILRQQVKDLPFSFRLDDAMAMSPAAKLSMHPKVVVSARVSKSGQAAPAPGDLGGQTPPVANTATGLVIEINEVVKN